MLGVASATENITDDVAPLEEIQYSMENECLKENMMLISNGNVSEKENFDAYIDFKDEVPKYSELNDYYYFSIKNIPQELEEKQVAIKIDNKSYTTEWIGEDVEIHPWTYSLGEHVISVDIPESEHYISKTLTKSFNVSEVVINIPKDITIDQNDFIEFCYPHNATGTITVKINGKQIYKKSLSNFVWIDGTPVLLPLNNLQFGNQTLIEATYTGNYPTKTKNVSATVTGYRFNVEMWGNPINFVSNGWGINYNGGDYFISLSPPYNGKALPTVMIDGKKCDLKLSDSDEYRYSVDVSKLEIGIHSVAISYVDDYYPLFSLNKTIYVKPLILTPFGYENGSDEFKLTLPKNATGNLNVHISNDVSITPNNETLLYKSIPLKDGHASFSVKNLVSGEYYFYVWYDGNDYNVTPTYHSLDLRVTALIPTVYHGEDKYITFYSYYDDNRLLTLLIGDYDEVYSENRISEKTYNLQMVNGIGKLKLSKFKVGHYYLDICYNGTKLDEYYDYSFYINQLCYFSVVKDINMYYGESKNYVLKVFKNGKSVNAGEIVNVKIGKQIIKVKTDKYGKIKVKLNQLPGKYKITATYKDATQTNNLVVKSVLNLKTVKVKKSAKKLTLQVTLKKGKTPIKNKKVTLKFAGKTYKVHTNKNGIAKVTVGKSILKKLKVGKKVSYQAIYLKYAIKKTAKVVK